MYKQKNFLKCHALNTVFSSIFLFSTKIFLICVSAFSLLRKKPIQKKTTYLINICLYEIPECQHFPMELFLKHLKKILKNIIFQSLYYSTTMCASKMVRISCHTMYAIYLSLCTLFAHSNPFQDIHCILYVYALDDIAARPGFFGLHP